MGDRTLHHWPSDFTSAVVLINFALHYNNLFHFHFLPFCLPHRTFAHTRKYVQSAGFRFVREAAQVMEMISFYSPPCVKLFGTGRTAAICLRLTFANGQTPIANAPIARHEGCICKCENKKTKRKYQNDSFVTLRNAGDRYTPSVPMHPRLERWREQKRLTLCHRQAKPF